MTNKKEVGLILECYFEGRALLESNQKVNTSLYFEFQDNNIEISKSQAYDFVHGPGKLSHVRNPDLFYALFQYGIKNNFSWNSKRLKEFKKIADPKEFLSKICKDSLPDQAAVASINKKLKKSISKNIHSSDEELKEKANNLFSIKNTSLILREKSRIIYTKINHGYWEFLLNSFLNENELKKGGYWKGLLKKTPSEKPISSRFRDLSYSSYPESWKTSGFHAVLHDGFDSVFRGGFDNSVLKIGVSLSAGDKPYSDTMSSEFTPSSRGALAGLNGFLESLGLNEPIELFEGSAPRDMIKDNTYKEFFDSQLNSYDALILIVPPGLKKLEFSNYKGITYKMTIPGQTVHETYRVSVPVIMGMINKLRKKHKRIGVLTQSAVLAPLVSIYIYHLFNDPSDDISFFDLGRILDISRPELIKDFPSLAWVVKQNLHFDVHKSFKLNESEENFHLCNLIDKIN